MADWYHRIDLYNLARLCSWIRLFTINHVALCTWTGRLYDRTKKQSKPLKQIDYIFFMLILLLAIIGIVRLLTGAIDVF